MRGQRIDPFTALETELSDTYRKAATPEDAIRVCKSLLDAARRVPSGSLYDEHRGYALFLGSQSGNSAADRDRQDQPWGPVHSPAADFAVRLCDATLRYWPEDGDGIKRSQRLGPGVRGAIRRSSKAGKRSFRTPKIEQRLPLPLRLPLE